MAQKLFNKVLNIIVGHLIFALLNKRLKHKKNDDEQNCFTSEKITSQKTDKKKVLNIT